MRALDLCDKTLRKNWRKFPHQFVVLAGGSLHLISSFDVQGFSVPGTADAEFRAGKRGRLERTPDGNMSPAHAKLQATYDNI